MKILKIDLDDYTLSDDPSAAFAGRCWIEGNSVWTAMMSSSGLYSYYYIYFDSDGEVATHTVGMHSPLLSVKSARGEWKGKVFFDSAAGLVYMDWRYDYTARPRSSKVRIKDKRTVRVMRAEHYIVKDEAEVYRWAEVLLLTDIEGGTTADGEGLLVFVPYDCTV